MSEKPLPMPQPEQAFYWEGAAQGKLLLQSCAKCGPYFPPRPFCPTCASRDVSVVEASGKGRLYSYVISHMPSPGYKPPYAVAVVELEEGPKLVSNILDCEQTPEALRIDMPVEVTFEKRGDVTIPQFRPAQEADT